MELSIWSLISEQEAGEQIGTTTQPLRHSILEFPRDLSICHLLLPWRIVVRDSFWTSWVLGPGLQSACVVWLVGCHGLWYQLMLTGPGLLLMWYCDSQIPIVYCLSTLIGWFLCCSSYGRQIESLIWDYVGCIGLVTVVACIIQPAWRQRISLRQACSSCVEVGSQVFLRRGLTMASFQSVMKSPLVSNMLTMHVMVGRQAVITSFNALVYWSDQVHSFCSSYPLFLSWLHHLLEWSKTCKFWCVCFFRMVLQGACERFSHFGYFVREEFSKALSYFLTSLTQWKWVYEFYILWGCSQFWIIPWGFCYCPYNLLNYYLVFCVEL